MATIQIQHAVKDYPVWKHAFDSDPLRRGRNGVIRHVVFRAAEDPNFVVVHLEFASRADAEAHMPSLRAMFPGVENAIGFGPEGVQTRILEEVEDVTY